MRGRPLVLVVVLVLGPAMGLAGCDRLARWVPEVTEDAPDGGGSGTAGDLADPEPDGEPFALADDGGPPLEGEIGSGIGLPSCEQLFRRQACVYEAIGAPLARDELRRAARDWARLGEDEGVREGVEAACLRGLDAVAEEFVKLGC